MTVCEQILAGRSDIRNYDIDNDFDNQEIEQLLGNGIISPRDIGMLKASDLIIDGVLDSNTYSLTDFPPYEQIRQLENGAVSPEDFLRRADLKTFDANDWLYLLLVIPELTGSAPWNLLNAEGSISRWMELLAGRPECTHCADWKKLAEKGSAEDFFRLLEQTPELYRHFTNKQELLAADPRRWAELIAVRPEMTAVYPPENFSRPEDVRFLLLHRPQMLGKVQWNEDTPPVSLHIINTKPEILEEIRPELAWFVSSDISDALRPILEKILSYSRADARRQANTIGHNAETFAGIYSSRSAETIIAEFQKAAETARLPLNIKMEEIHHV